MTFAYNKFVSDNDSQLNNPTAAENFLDITSAGRIQLIAIYLLSFTAQVFYSMKIWSSTRNMLFVLPIVVLSIVQIVAGMIQTKEGIKACLINLANTERMFVLQGSASAACDILITLVLCYDIRGQQSGFRHVDNLLKRMTFYAINRGTATSVCALLTVILFVTGGNSFRFQIPLFIGAYSYVASVVSMLITEETFQQAVQEENKSIVLSGLELPNRTIPANPDIRVEIQHSAVTWDDMKGVDSNSSNGSRRSRTINGPLDV